MVILLLPSAPAIASWLVFSFPLVQAASASANDRAATGVAAGDAPMARLAGTCGCGRVASAGGAGFGRSCLASARQGRCCGSRPGVDQAGLTATESGAAGEFDGSIDSGRAGRCGRTAKESALVLDRPASAS